MALRLNVAVSRKVGLPGYCSAGASCGVEVELDAAVLRQDPGAFHARVRAAFAAARQAVDDELARIQAELTAPPRAAVAEAPPRADRAPLNGGPPESPAAEGRTGAPAARGPRRCTGKQARAIRAIARGLGCDLGRLLQDEYRVVLPDELTLDQASRLIDSLRRAGVP